MGTNRWAAVLGGLGLLVLAGAVVQVVAVRATEPLVSAVETTILAVSGVALLSGAAHLRRSTYEAASAGRVVGWSLGGTVLLAAVGIVVVYSGSTMGVSAGELFDAATVSGGVGAALGLLVGLQEARSMEETRDVEHARSRAREEAQLRGTVEYLNALLRHNVLNAANVIAGTIQQLRRRGDVDHEAELRTVEARSEEMADLATNVGTLLRAATVDREPRPVDLAETVEYGVAAVRSRHPDATVTVDVPEDLDVLGDDFLRDGVESLLAAAAASGDDPPRLSVTAERADDRVHLFVTTDGRLPPRIRERPFERTNEGDDDIRLVLVGVVVDPYGEATLAGSDASGTTFRLSFSPALRNDGDDRGDGVTDPAPGFPAP